MNKERICLTMDIEILSEIDRIRGLIPRSTYINEKLKELYVPAGTLPSETAGTANDRPIKESASDANLHP